MRARYASFAASFLLTLGAGTVLALAARSGAAPPSAAAESRTTGRPQRNSRTASP